MRARYTTVLLVALLLAAAVPASAQRYNFHTYSELEGLPSSAVHDLAQDDDGLLWLATARGLVRYDGVAWEKFGPFGTWMDTDHILVERDADGVIWTFGRAPDVLLLRWDGDSWTRYPVPQELITGAGVNCWALGETPGGTVAVMGERGGRLIVFDGSQWLTHEAWSPDLDVSSLGFAHGYLWSATNQGLFRIDPVAGHVEPTAIREPIMAYTPALAGGDWFIGSDWIGRGDPSEVRIVLRDVDFELDHKILEIEALAGPAGGLYFGDLNRVHFYHPAVGHELMTRENGLQSDGVTSFLLDREGHVWVSGLRGVSKLVNRSLAGHDVRAGLLRDEVSAIARRPDGTMVLGHDGGLTLFGTEIETFAFGQGLPRDQRVMDLTLGSDGAMWFVADQLGIGRLAPDGAVTFLPAGETTVKGASSLLFDQAGTLWVGGQEGVMRREPDGRFVRADLPYGDDPRNDMIRRLYLRSDGALAVGLALGGVIIRDADGAVRVDSPRDDRGGEVFSLHEGPHGELLVGTVSGLFMVAGDQIVRPGPGWPEINRPVYAINSDAAGRTWFGTDNGVMVWDGADLRHMTARDGLLGTEANRDALLPGDGGDMWIGTDRGLTVYRSELDTRPDVLPLVRLTRVITDDRDHPVARPVELNRPPALLEFLFRGITFRDENRTRYQTRLVGLDQEWSAPMLLPSRQVRYTNVPPGEYRFEVRVQAGDGRLSEVASSGPLRIAPPLQRRAWFLALLVLAGVIGVWMIANTFTTRRLATDLQARVEARTRDLQASEASQRAESQRLATTLESISDGVIALDGDDRIVLVNQAAETLLGRSAADLVGRPWTEAAQLEPPLQLAPGPPAMHEVAGSADGSGYWLEFSVALLAGDEEGPSGRVLAFRDVTARRELENQRLRTQQLESLGVLAGGIAHDFNNLLTIIMGNVSLVEDAGSVQSEERARLDQVKAAAENARALTEQFLTFARGGDPCLEPVLLEPVLRQAAALVFSGADVTYRLEVAPDLQAVLADPGQLAQVLNNLLLNAVQAMDDGGEVEVRAWNCPACDEYGQGRPCVRVEIRDEGIGIASGDLERIFDPYFTTKEGGTGLGLAIAHSIVRRHGGLLRAESQAGVGSRFTMSLPATTRLSASVGAPEPVARLDGRRVLLLDDEPEVREVALRMLETLGCRCVMTRDGAQTIEMYAAAQADGESFDVVIADLTVPGGMGGRETMERLLEIDPEVTGVVASGYSHDPVLAHPQGFGFQAALRKPYDRDDLAAVLTRVLGRGDSAS